MVRNIPWEMCVPYEKGTQAAWWCRGYHYHIIALYVRCWRTVAPVRHLVFSHVIHQSFMRIELVDSARYGIDHTPRHRGLTVAGTIIRAAHPVDVEF